MSLTPLSGIEPSLHYHEPHIVYTSPRDGGFAGDPEDVLLQVIPKFLQCNHVVPPPATIRYWPNPISQNQGRESTQKPCLLVHLPIDGSTNAVHTSYTPHHPRTISPTRLNASPAAPEHKPTVAFAKLQALPSKGSLINLPLGRAAEWQAEGLELQNHLRRPKAKAAGGRVWLHDPSRSASLGMHAYRRSSPQKEPYGKELCLQQKSQAAYHALHQNISLSCSSRSSWSS